MIIATNIKTELWNKIIGFFIEDKWTVTYKYDNFDAGIDADFVIMERSNDEILFGWDNWFEGEIQCSEELMKRIEHRMQMTFEIGQPTNLKPEVIELHRKWKAENLFNNPGLLCKR
jgi:hypothetical protein